MKILVINSGSSSIKYQLFEMDSGKALSAGVVERIGEAESRISHHVLNSEAPQEIVIDIHIKDHRDGLEQVSGLLLDQNVGVIGTASEIAAVGHRVVHGGEEFSQPTIIDDAVKAAIKALSPLAPLHNPPNLLGIEVVSGIFPTAVQVAVFDTAFHQTLPAKAYRYAIPNRLYDEHDIRAYGMHGTSHRYVTNVAIDYLGLSVRETNLITIHLGNGCSMAAVKGGFSVDTSMGFSPLAGLMMGTRSGDIDPTVIYFLGTRLNMSFDEIDDLLNKQSGLLGISGHNDLRDVLHQRAEGDENAQLALDMYTYRIKKYIGSYLAVLGDVNAIVFTAGVGENSAEVRWDACSGLENLGIILDPEKNRTNTGVVTEIQAAYSPIKVLVIKTDEEFEIARQTAATISG